MASDGDDHPWGDDVRVFAGDVTAAAGWTRKPEGIYREDICIPVPDGREPALFGEDGDELNLSAFARLIEQPVAANEDLGAAYFGAAACSRI